MNYRLIVCLIFSVFSSNILAQTKVEIKPCTSTGVVCVGNTDSLKNHCITVVAKGGAGKYKIDWGDSKTQLEDIVGQKQLFHEYDVKAFLNSCTPLKEIEVGARNEVDATDNVKYDIFFGRSPNPVPVVKQACEGQPILFDNNSCPEGTGVSYKWEFNDGRTSSK